MLPTPKAPVAEAQPRGRELDGRGHVCQISMNFTRFVFDGIPNPCQSRVRPDRHSPCSG